MDGEFENESYLQYKGGATYVRRCEICCRFVKADESITVRWADDQPVDQPNATCSKCGRVKMIFIGFV